LAAIPQVCCPQLATIDPRLSTVMRLQATFLTFNAGWNNLRHRKRKPSSRQPSYSRHGKMRVFNRKHTE
jgi:hypothetical protein